MKEDRGSKNFRYKESQTSNFKKGVTFEVPCGSLITTAKYEIFDDLLIENFMKTTLHGD